MSLALWGADFTSVPVDICARATTTPAVATPNSNNAIRVMRIPPSKPTDETHYVEPLLFTLGSRRLGRILDLAGFVVRLSSMARMFALGLIVELCDGHMLEPIALLAFRTVHGRITGRRRIGAMKMVKA